MEDILDILETEHDQVKELIKKILESGSGAVKTREQSYSKFKKALLEHMFAEENTFYPLLLQKAEDKETIYEAFEEHRVVRLALPDLDTTDVADEQWKPKFKAISEVVKHHIEEEEDAVFDQAKDVLDKESRAQLAEDFKNAKQEANIKI